MLLGVVVRGDNGVAAAASPAAASPAAQAHLVQPASEPQPAREPPPSRLCRPLPPCLRSSVITAFSVKDDLWAFWYSGSAGVYRSGAGAEDLGGHAVTVYGYNDTGRWAAAAAAAAAGRRVGGRGRAREVKEGCARWGRLETCARQWCSVQLRGFLTGCCIQCALRERGAGAACRGALPSRHPLLAPTAAGARPHRYWLVKSSWGLSGGQGFSGTIKVAYGEGELLQLAVYS